MPFNFYETHNLLMAVEQLTPPTTFLRDRYLPNFPRPPLSFDKICFFEEALIIFFMHQYNP